MNWNSEIADFKSYLKLEKNLSDRSIEAYLSDVIKFGTYVQNQFELDSNDVTPIHIQQYLSEIVDQNLSARSQARYISSLKAFFGYLVLENRMEINPMELIESPKLGLKLPDTLSENEINMIIDQIDLSDPFGHRNKAILEMLYGCGLRVSEVTQLRFSDLFLEENFIRVLGKGNKQRLVPITNATIKELQLYTEHSRKFQKEALGFEDYIFLNRRGKTLSRVMVFLIIKDLVAEVGLKKKVSPHTFRHSFATHLLHNGADIRAIQLMLGHESITTTEIYTHIEQRHLEETILTYHPRNRD